jgi:HAD superfamily hydrolase (TIGR01490 family)
MMKLAFFDFCETLVCFQTADAFIDHIRETEGTIRMRFLNRIYLLLNKLRIIALANIFFPGSSFGKRIKLLQLRGMLSSDIERMAHSFYEKKIIPGQIETVMQEMRNLSRDGFEICIVSAGYSIYLKYFAAANRINHLIASEIGFDKTRSRCLGTISGKDCINIQKINRIKEYFKDHDIDYNECIAYSDSISDLPLLQLTGRAVVISRSGPQAWCAKHNFKEIIWDQN